MCLMCVPVIRYSIRMRTSNGSTVFWKRLLLNHTSGETYDEACAYAFAAYDLD